MANFINPIPNSYLTSPFGWRTHPVTHQKQSWHQGIDLAIKPNTNVKVLASADGKVIRVGKLGTYGNVVMIQHKINGKRMDTNYAHLKDGSMTVKVNQTVKQGDVIGIMGNTGSSTAHHLHFEIHNGEWKTGQPNAIDPLSVMDLKSKLDTGELTMSQYNELKKIIDAQAKEIAQLKVDKLDKPKKSNTPSSWAKTAWEWATKFKNKKGESISDGTNPQDYITREQVTVMLNRYDNK